MCKKGRRGEEREETVTVDRDREVETGVTVIRNRLRLTGPFEKFADELKD